MDESISQKRWFFSQCNKQYANKVIVRPATGQDELGAVVALPSA